MYPAVEACRVIMSGGGVLKLSSHRVVFGRVALRLMFIPCKLLHVPKHVNSYYSVELHFAAGAEVCLLLFLYKGVFTCLH